MKVISKVATTILIMGLFLLPAIVFAQLAPTCEGPDCGLSDLVSLIQRLINWIIWVAAPVAMILFAYAGLLLVTSGGSQNKMEQAKAIFKNVAIGFAIILSAWLIVYTITTALIDDDFRDDIPIKLEP